VPLVPAISKLIYMYTQPEKEKRTIYEITSELLARVGKEATRREVKNAYQAITRRTGSGGHKLFLSIGIRNYLVRNSICRDQTV